MFLVIDACFSTVFYLLYADNLYKYCQVQPFGKELLIWLKICSPCDMSTSNFSLYFQFWFCPHHYLNSWLLILYFTLTLQPLSRSLIPIHSLRLSLRTASCVWWCCKIKKRKSNPSWGWGCLSSTNPTFFVFLPTFNMSRIMRTRTPWRSISHLHLVI